MSSKEGLRFKRDVIPRQEVMWFAVQMEKKLNENDHKDWPGNTEEDLEYCLNRIKEEIAELERCIVKRQYYNAIKESADVGNFAMFISNIAKYKYDYAQSFKISRGR